MPSLSPGALTPPNPTTEGADTFYTVFTFSNTVQGSYDAVITWGDGETDSPLSLPAGTYDAATHLYDFTVNDNHVYDELKGSGPFEVDILDHATQAKLLSASTLATFNIGDAALTAGTLNVPTGATEGQSWSEASPIFHFTDGTSPNVLWPALDDFTALITWGDGTTSTLTSDTTPDGVISFTDGSDGISGMDVWATHTYAEEGPLSGFQVEILDEGGSTLTTTPSSVTVADAPLTNTTVLTLSGVEGQVFCGTVFQFTDGNPIINAADFTTASIDWGDGTTSTLGAALNPASIVWDAAAGAYDLVGTHQYHENTSLNKYDDGSPATINVHVWDDGGADVVGSATMTFADAPLIAGPLTEPDAVAGQRFAGTVFRFTDTNPDAPASDFNSAFTYIEWGDGNTDYVGGGNVTVVASGGGFSVRGTHTYTSAINGTFTVNVADEGGSDLIAAAAVSVPVSTQMTMNPVPEVVVPIGEVGVGVNTGDLRLSHPLDFDLSPGTAVGGNPALDYNSNIAAPDPVVKVPVSTDPAQGVPTSVVATLTWNGTAQSAVTFTSFGTASAGDTIVLGVPVASSPSSSDNYSWSMSVVVHYSSSSTTYTYSGTMPVVANPALHFGNGWGIDGVDRILSVTGGVILLHGNGDFEFFANSTAGTYINPPYDFGTLTHASTYTYTTPDGTTESFDSSGYLTKVVDRDALTRTYSYDGSHDLTGVLAADGGSTTLTYSGGALASIIEPGGSTVTVGETSGNLTSLTDVDGSHRTFTYGSSSLLSRDQWTPYDASFTYGAANVVTTVNRGLSSTYSIAAAATQELTSALPYNQAGNATITDPLAHTTTYTLDWPGYEVAETKPDGAVTAWDRDSHGNATLTTDPLGNATSDTYDASGYVVTDSRPDGSYSKYGYGTYHQVTQMIESEIHGSPDVTEVTSYTLNGSGDVIKTVDPANATTTYGWNTSGLMTSMIDGRGKTSTYAYDSHRRLTAFTDPLLTEVTSYTYDTNGNQATVIDPRLQTTTTQYDAKGQLTKEIDPDTNTISYQYDAAGDLTAMIDARTITTNYLFDQRGWETKVVEAVGAADVRTSTKAYDVAGNVTADINFDGKTTTLAYDAANRQTLVTNPDTTGTTQTLYDADDNVIETIDALNNPTFYQYDTVGQLTKVTDALHNMSTKGYDLAGNLTKETDGNGHATTYAYDADNRLTQTIDPAGATTSKSYDADGDVVTEVDGRGNTTVYAYDDADRLTKTTTTAVAGTVTQTLTYQNLYDAAGNVTKTVDPLNQATTFYFDNAGLLTKTIDPATITTQKVYDADGNVIKTINGRTLTTTYSFDDGNRLTKTIDAATLTTQAAFDPEGNVTQTIDGDGTTITYALDNDGRVTLTTEVKGLTSISTQDAYDLDGNLTQEIDPVGATVIYGYDKDNRVTSTLKILISGGTTLTYQSAYDSVGNVLQSIDPLGEITSNAYDGDNRLTWTKEAVATPAGFQTISTQESYDKDGNVTQVIDALGKTTSSVFDTDNRLIQTTEIFGGVTYSTSTVYDQDGNVLTSVDDRNHTVSYAYDADNRLTQTIDQATLTTKMVYDGDGNVINTVDGRTLTITYAFDNDDRLTQTIDPLTHTTKLAYDANGNVLTSTDARGFSTQYFYDYLNRVTEIIAPGPGVASYTSWKYGNVTADVNAQGRTTTSSYDLLDRLTKTIDTNGFTTQEVYDKNGNVVNSIDARTLTTTYAYDADNRLTKTIDPLNITTWKFYDANGNVTASVDGRSLTTTYAYDNDDRLTWTKNPAGNTSQSVYDQNGNVTLSVDGNNKTTTYSFDNDNRLTKTLDPASITTYKYYDNDGNVTADVDGNNHTTTYLYDNANHLTEIIDRDNYSSFRYYDADGNVTQAVDNRGLTTTYSYDDADRLTKTIDPLSHTTQQAYDNNGNITLTVDARGLSTTYYFDWANTETAVTDPLGFTTFHYYDHDGNLTKIIDPLLKNTTYSYDSDNRLTLTKDPNLHTTQQAYDADGNLTLVVDPDNNSTTFSYDGAGRKTGTIDAFGHGSFYSYDGDGNMTLSVDRLGRSDAFVYDNDGRLLTETWYAADGVTVMDTLVYTYDADAQILTAGNSQGTYTISYDADERATKSIDPFGVTLTMNYDKDGNRTSLVDSLGGTQTFTYNNGNLLVGEAFKSGATNVAQISLSYDNDNQISVVTYYGGGSPAPVVATANFGRDSNERVTSISDQNSSLATIAAYTLGYDANGNLTQQTDHSTTTSYAYDNAGQFTSANQTGALSSNYTYSYDAAGNRNSTGYTTTTGNEMTNDGTYSYTYDLEGNEITKTKTGDTFTLAYDNANHVTSVVENNSGVTTTTLYKYDAFGNRIETDVGATTTRYALDGWDPSKPTGPGNGNWDVLADLDGSNSLKTRYLRGDSLDQVFARLTYNGSAYTPYYYLTDAEGSIRDVINTAATVMDAVAYDPYGNIVSETNSTFRGRYGWDSREMDSSDGLIYNRARYYDPRTGRWLSQDPDGFDAGDSNLYRYVNNRPVNATDPSGLQIFLPSGGLLFPRNPNPDPMVFMNRQSQQDTARQMETAQARQIAAERASQAELWKKAAEAFYSDPFYRSAELPNGLRVAAVPVGDSTEAVYFRESPGRRYAFIPFSAPVTTPAFFQQERSPFYPFDRRGRLDENAFRALGVVVDLGTNVPPVRQIVDIRGWGSGPGASLDAIRQFNINNYVANSTFDSWLLRQTWIPLWRTAMLFERGRVVAGVLSFAEDVADVVTTAQVARGVTSGARALLNASRSGSGLAASGELGARGLVSGREFQEFLAGGPTRNLTTNQIRVTERGIAVVEGHVARFGPDAANNQMIQRLRDIASGTVNPTQVDLNFYSHELREFVRYRRNGFATGVPQGANARHALWNATHSATLEDYGLRGVLEDLYHPDAIVLISP